MKFTNKQILFGYKKSRVYFEKASIFFGWKLYLSPYFLVLFALGYVYLFLAIDISSKGSLLATKYAGPPLNDVFFSLLPLIITSIHAFSLYAWFFFQFFPIFFPRLGLFSLYSMSTLVILRTIFVNLTHLGIPSDAQPIFTGNTFGGDLFFSGHVATPFLMALIFWEYRIIRLVLLFFVCVVGLNTLLGRYHYSIDVFAAPFIAYGVYSIMLKIFNVVGLSKDLKNDFFSKD